MRLIDADALYELIDGGYDINFDEVPETKRELLRMIDEQETIDADEWCTDCKEYDKEAHCCHRWTKVIRNTVDELLAQGYERVKHGQWLDEQNYLGTHHTMFFCSECGSASWREDPYCWHCGAKMEVEDDADE